MKPEVCDIYMGQLNPKESSYKYFIARSHQQRGDDLGVILNNGCRYYIIYIYIVVSNGPCCHDNGL